MQAYIDFDGTLFDTDKYNQDITDVFNKYGISKKKLDETKKLLFNQKNLFNIDIITNYIIEEYNLDTKIKKEISALLNKSYIYEDVSTCLEKMTSMGYELNILTYGDKKFQTKKIQSTNITKYFKEIIITEKDKSKLNLDYKNGLFIDNNPKEIENLSKSQAKKIIRLRRESDKYANIDTNILNVIECKDFYQLIKLIEEEYNNE